MIITQVKLNLSQMEKSIGVKTTTNNCLLLVILNGSIPVSDKWKYPKRQSLRNCFKEDIPAMLWVSCKTWNQARFFGLQAKRLNFGSCCGRFVRPSLAIS